jgi:hypothetical protein
MTRIVRSTRIQAAESAVVDRVQTSFPSSKTPGEGSGLLNRERGGSILRAFRGATTTRHRPQRISYWNRVKLDFSRPGRPSDNAFCESFNNRARQELLNPNWFRSLADARAQAAAWRADYNVNHPHSSLGNFSPEEYARRAKNILNASPFLERSWRKNGETSIYENSPLILGGMMGIRHGRSTRLACTSTLVNRTYFGSANGNRTPPLRSRPIPSIDENAYLIGLSALHRSSRFRPLPRRFGRSVTDL